jgi:hypothetical protein
MGLAGLTLVCLACESLPNRSILTCFKLLPGLVVHVILLSILVYVWTVVIIMELKMYILGTHFDIHSGQPKYWNCQSGTWISLWILLPTLPAWILKSQDSILFLHSVPAYPLSSPSIWQVHFVLSPHVHVLQSWGTPGYQWNCQNRMESGILCHIYQFHYINRSLTSLLDHPRIPIWYRKSARSLLKCLTCKILTMKTMWSKSVSNDKGFIMDR